jgi:hypothetical protein
MHRFVIRRRSTRASGFRTGEDTGDGGHCSVNQKVTVVVLVLGPGQFSGLCGHDLLLRCHAHRARVYVHRYAAGMGIDCVRTARPSSVGKDLAGDNRRRDLDGRRCQGALGFLSTPGTSAPKTSYGQRGTRSGQRSDLRTSPNGNTSREGPGREGQGAPPARAPGPRSSGSVRAEPTDGSGSLRIGDAAALRISRRRGPTCRHRRPCIWAVGSFSIEVVRVTRPPG